MERSREGGREGKINSKMERREKEGIEIVKWRENECVWGVVRGEKDATPFIFCLRPWLLLLDNLVPCSCLYLTPSSSPASSPSLCPG